MELWIRRFVDTVLDEHTTCVAGLRNDINPIYGMLYGINKCWLGRKLERHLVHTD